MSNKDSSKNSKRGSVLIVGGGIGGMQAALDLGDAEFKVYMIQKESSIGGTMAMLDKTFPTGDCAMCMLSPKMVDVGRHPNIEIHSGSKVIELDGNAGRFDAKVLKKARYVDLDKCTGCEACVEVCPVLSESDHDQGLIKSTAISRRYAQAVPGAVAVDKQGVSPCRIACPAETNAHAYTALIGKRRYAEALEVVRRTNPFPASIGRVCTHPCETACRRGDLDDPISICYLKRFLVDWEDQNGGFIAPQLPEEKLEKVAVIGSGPAGLTAARDLSLKGYRVTVFEKLPLAGGMLAVGIPEYRLPKSVLKKEIDTILAHDIELKCNQEFGKDFTLEDLKNSEYRAFFIALGAHRSLKLKISGEDEYEGVWNCTDFLRKVNLGEDVDIGKKVVVIGGGNAAIDSARTSVRLGADVTIAYRRTQKEMPANSWEIEEAKEEDVIITTLVAPIAILGENGKVSGIQCLRMKLGEPDESGRRRPIPIEGSEFIIETDMVISAISQETDIELINETGLKTNRWNFINTDKVTLATNIDGVFAGGDAAIGPSTVVEAIAMGAQAAESIHRYLRGKDMYADREKLASAEKSIKDITGIEPSPGRKMPKISLEDRKGNFKEVELGFNEDDSIAEALRCLNCAGCCECLLCVGACEAEAIDHEMVKEEETTLKVGSVILSPGLDRYNPKIRAELGFGRWPNVITSMQFERILSASGPYMGKVTRPGDGKHPGKIAWVQCVGSRDPHNANPWCSSVCCMYATKQSVIAKEHDSSIEPTIFYMDMRAFGKDFDKYVDRAKNEYGVRYQRAMISIVREEPETGNLLVRYAGEDGKLVDEVFDMVVLSIGLEPHSDATEFAGIFGIDTNEYRFAKTGQFTPVETSKPGVYVTGTYQGPKDIPETVMQGSAVAGRAMALLAEARGSDIVKKDLLPETDVKDQEARIGVFVCSCGINIAGTVDVGKVVDAVKDLPNVSYAENLLYACSQDSQEKVKELIKEKSLNRILVASCTPRTHTPLFQDTIRDVGLNKYLFELADIREQCSWCHMGNNEAATEKAIKIVKMNIAKVRFLEPVETDSVDVLSSAMIIGGGVAGMIAALSLADQGFDTNIIEKEDELGGLAKDLNYTLDRSDVQRFLKETITQVENHPKITVHKEVEVLKTIGFVGNFETTLTNGNTFNHGAIIIATGGIEYEPNEYMFGENDRIITQRNLEKRIKHEELTNGKRFIMIQCVGSREEPHNYCSRVCCQDAIKNAIAIKEKTPDAQVVILYRDVRTYGLREDYYRKARDIGVIFMRFEKERKPEVVLHGNDITIKAFDYTLYREITMDADYLVLSTGLRPHPSADKVGNMYKLTRNLDGFFVEAHPKLRPVDFPSEGIFMAGLAHAPKNLDETLNQALAAAGRAGVLLSHDKLEVSGIVAKQDDEVCVSCLTCMRVCPFDSPYINEDGKVRHNEIKCMGCGICASICPNKAFQINNFKDDQIMAMVDAATENL